MDGSEHALSPHLEAAEAALSATGDTFDPGAMRAFRTIVSGYPDMGAEGAGEVVASLFMLLDNLIASGRMDQRALEVHVQAWRLMSTSPPTEKGKAVLLQGLKAIRDLSAQAKAA